MEEEQAAFILSVLAGLQLQNLAGGFRREERSYLPVCCVLIIQFVIFPSILQHLLLLPPTQVSKINNFHCLLIFIIVR